MADPQAPQRPIGWWLKEADRLLDAAFDRSLQGADVDRRGWQVLTSLSRQPVTRPDLVGSLGPFDPPEVIENAVSTLVARGLVDDSDASLRLTAAGARRQQALAPRVNQVRHQVTAALPQDDYAALVQLLEQLVTGLRPPPEP